MRTISFAALATISALTLIGSAAATPRPRAEATQDSYCLQGRQSGYPGNCEFSTYQQCQATASGTNEGCGINPMKAFAQQRRGAYRSQY
ncbi:DUF3551 domain-containing protein [Bradyrhizobium sp. LTSP857]|uniref:DUF3551 domain-containing protein n=1 Tax=Bradyrhizobium sp. LTSP857 TaxID=1619231 RepID=UPI0009E5C4D3|nr:DUF3551 domain-containing protein [Bradyrhizobium sp. LTSP857]